MVSPSESRYHAVGQPGLIVIFGSATLILQDETFIKWKPSVLYWLFAGTLLSAQAVFKKNLIRIDDERANHPARAGMDAAECQLGRVFRV